MKIKVVDLKLSSLYLKMIPISRIGSLDAIFFVLIIPYY